MYVEFMIGMTVPETDSDKGISKKDKISRKDKCIITIMAVTLILAIIGAAPILWDWISPGEVRPIQPSGYGIIREIDPHPSDHILLPLEWENTGRRHELVRQPYLVLREIETGTKYRFPLAGEYPDISQNSLGKGYIIKESLILDPHSISPKVLVFHVDNFWNKSHEDYNFRFTEGENYNVSIGFQRKLDKQPEVVLFDMPIRSDIDILDSAEWEYWPIHY